MGYIIVWSITARYSFYTSWLVWYTWVDSYTLVPLSRHKAHWLTSVDVDALLHMKHMIRLSCLFEADYVLDTITVCTHLNDIFDIIFSATQGWGSPYLLAMTVFVVMTGFSLLGPPLEKRLLYLNCGILSSLTIDKDPFPKNNLATRIFGYWYSLQSSLRVEEKMEIMFLNYFL